MSRTRAASVILMAGTVMSIAPGWARAADVAVDQAVVGAVNGTTLYLQAGEVDTSVARRDLGAFIAGARGKGKAAAGGLGGRYFVLQFDGPMRPAWRDRLVAAGVAVGDYLPMNAVIARLDRADAKAVAGLEFVRWFGEYQTGWKLAPGVGERALQSAERLELAGAGRALVIVTLFAGEASDQAVGHIAGLAGAQVHWVDSIGENLCVAVTVLKKDIAGLAGLVSVQFIEDAPEPTLRNDTDRWIVQSNVPNATPLYAAGLHGEGQILGLLDTRLDRNHCSFTDTQPIGPLHRKIVAYNSGAGAEFHGTHVAGTAVGDHDDSTATRGIAYLGKVAYNTMPNFNETEMVARLNTHHSQGARVHTNSWGDDGTTQYNSLCRGVDVFSYANEDDLILFAVTNTSSLKNPENAKNLLAVGASEDNPSQGNHCSGGNGPTTDQRRKPEIYAPGCGTNSASAGSGCGTAGATGTSMACPAVAATGMLVRQYFVDGLYPTGTRRSEDAMIPSGALVKAVLLNSAVDMTGVAGYPSTREGWGRVLADDALFFEGDARRLLAVDVRNAQGLTTSQSVEYPVTVLGAGEKLKITLAWTEPAATAGVSFAAINDLDLEVVGPGGELYRGNFFVAGQSATGGTRDDRNNVEQVHIEAPAPGAYTVRIVGAAVNQGTQGFALAATGDIFTPAAGVSVQLATELPPAIPAGEAFAVRATIDAGADELVADSATLHVRLDDGPFQSVPMVLVTGTTYEAMLPAPVCAERPEFYFSAEGVESGIRTAPALGEAAPYVVRVGEAMVAFADAMEENSGWTAGAQGDSASSGIWTRVAPNAGTGVPPTDHSDPGTMCFITGQESPFGGGNQNDVDSGGTSLVSPAFDLSGDASAVVGYWRWYSNTGPGEAGADTLVVQASSDGGATWATIEEVGPTGEGSQGGWQFHQASLDGVIELTDQVRIRFLAQDLGADSTIEAGIDDVRIDAIACVGEPECACDWDESGVLNSQDFFAFVTSFFAGAGDFNRNGGVDSQDFFDFVACFFFGCP